MKRILFGAALAFTGAVTSLVGYGAGQDAIAQAEKSEKHRPGIIETKATAEEAYLYGFPMVVGYSVLNKFFIDRNSGQFKAPINTLNNEARVFTPKDTAISTPNSDTPYSMAMLDLRAEPMVLCMPQIEKARYYDVQLIDLYTNNYGHMGSRTTGNGAGCYLVSGPEWQGEIPPGIASAFRSETQLGLVLYRTQLFNPADMDNVKKVQAGYKLQPLSAFLGKPAPPRRTGNRLAEVDAGNVHDRLRRVSRLSAAVRSAGRNRRGREAVAREVRRDRHWH